MNRRASCFLFLAALLWLRCFPAFAIRPQPLETRIGGCEQFASGQTSVVAVQTPGNAMGLRGFAYKTASGRLKWPNQDPVQERGGLNLYRFVGNDPINGIDPSGLLGGEADANPVGINGVPYISLTFNPSSDNGGNWTVSNNDDLYTLLGPFAAGAVAGASAVDPFLGAMAAQDLIDALKNNNKCDSQTAVGAVRLVPNPKHHVNSRSPEPSNVRNLWNQSIEDENGVRWAIDDDGVIHRFSKPRNDLSHWNGCTRGPNPISRNNIPNDILKALEEGGITGK